MPHHHTLKVYGTKLTFVQEFKDVKIFLQEIIEKI